MKGVLRLTERTVRLSSGGSTVLHRNFNRLDRHPLISSTHTNAFRKRRNCMGRSFRRSITLQASGVSVSESALTFLRLQICKRQFAAGANGSGGATIHFASLAILALPRA